jgi:peroxiredoxin
MEMTKSKICIFIILFSLAGQNYAQQIEIQISNYKGNLYISELSGEKVVLVDSVSTYGDGICKFSLDRDKHHTGIYRISFENSTQPQENNSPAGRIDFIYDGEDVILKTDAHKISDSLKVILSKSNTLYYQFIKLNKAYKTKSELLQLILSRYPEDDEYYTQTMKRLNELQREYKQFINQTSKENPDSFIANYITSSQLPITDISYQQERQISYLRAHALDNVDFNNSSLIYSDVFTNKTIEYLTYYRNPDLPLEMLEKEFMNAVDSVLNKAKVNQLVYQQIIGYLIDGFKKYGFDKVLDYIVENYVIKDDLCLDVKTEGLIKRRINQAKFFRVGSIIPNIILPDSAGNKFELNKTKATDILIVFYASWCPHCKDLLPRLNELYKSQKEKKFEVYSISLDSNRKDWTDFTAKNNLAFINVSDLKGWEGKAASDYYIYATPTMFMVDKQMKIISKPGSIEEVRRIVN